MALFCVIPLSAQPIEPHWSLRPLVKPTPPDATKHPIDAFVDAHLAKRGFQRAPAADHRTLIRRLSFGLTGLPPTPHEVQSFTSNKDPDAYAELVDRLLASPRYGEHWARHWLDVAQYADTHGNDHDYRRPNAWPYRDYVIRSLNDDKPYARFVEEQVAGDALFPDSPDATIALGFLAAGPWDDTLMITIRPDTIDHRMGQNLDRDGMVSAVMGTFQSLTVHCARCHDHKFDPVSQREYYALQAVFAGCDRTDRPVDADPNLHALRHELLERKLAINRRDPLLLKELSSPTVASKIATIEKEYNRSGSIWKQLDITAVSSTQAASGTTFTREKDGSWFVSGERPTKDTFLVSAQTNTTGIRAVKLEVLPDKRLPTGGPGRYDNGNFHLAEFRAAAAPVNSPTTEPSTLEFAGVVADHSDRGDLVENALDGKPETYWSIHPHYNLPHQAVFTLVDPAGFAGGTSLSISLQFTGKPGHQIGRFRLWITTEKSPEQGGLPNLLPAEVAKLLEIPADNRSPAQRQELALRVLEEDVDRQRAALPEPEQQVYAVAHDFETQNGFTPALFPRPIHLLTRGDLNQPGDLVHPGSLSCVPDLPGALNISNNLDESSRRAALAKWLTDDRNVLTWRSIVNRVWHWHFGRGLCATPNDFGKMGAAPSHPQLLDWLAIWFRDEAKGSLKALHRLIVTSETYQQQVIGPAQSKAALVDHDNRLLWRMNRQRLTAEQLRDGVLHLSAQLDTRMGGSPALHFLHKGDETFKNSAPPFVDYLNFDRNSPDNKRRAIYRFIFRTVPDPLMDALDCPDGSGAVPVRATSSTAQQALAMLNDAFLIRQAEQIALRIASENADAPILEQVRNCFAIILQRAPSTQEGAKLAEYATRHGLANTCHLLLNTNEFLYLD